jgi:gliding motility associated protien GldN
MKKIIGFINVGLMLLFASASFAQAEFPTESSEPSEDMYIDDIVKKRLTVENQVLAYEPIRESDIAWQKRVWRVIETREKMNLSFRYPEKFFFTILTELIENGDITVFQDEKFKNPLTYEDVAAKLSRVDTVTAFNYDTYVEEIKIVKNDINPADINKYRLKEIYFFDEESSTMKVRILGISPIKESIDENTGELKYIEPLFWVYYPEAREYLAKHAVFNDLNDAAPMTWSDLFEKRYFSSYIMKRSNVLDYRISDMYKDYDRAGIDQLLESQRIKNELLNFEHDLWTY